MYFEVDALPAPFSFVFNVFLECIIDPYGYEYLVLNRYVEIYTIFKKS